MAAVLETNALGKRYGKKWALKDCTLSVPTRSMTGLVGLNGAGKTTLIHLALGLIEPSTAMLRYWENLLVLRMRDICCHASASWHSVILSTNTCRSRRYSNLVAS